MSGGGTAQSDDTYPPGNARLHEGHEDHEGHEGNERRRHEGHENQEGNERRPSESPPVHAGPTLRLVEEALLTATEPHVRLVGLVEQQQRCAEKMHYETIEFLLSITSNCYRDCAFAENLRQIAECGVEHIETADGINKAIIDLVHEHLPESRHGRTADPADSDVPTPGSGSTCKPSSLLRHLQKNSAEIRRLFRALGQTTQEIPTPNAKKMRKGDKCQEDDGGRQ